MTSTDSAIATQAGPVAPPLESAVQSVIDREYQYGFSTDIDNISSSI